MRPLNFKPVIFLYVLISFFGCEPEPTPVEEIYADVIFFVRNPSNCGLITVNLDGFASQSITEQEYSPMTPFCGDSDKGAVFRNLTPGTYNYSAVCDNNEVSGTFNVNEAGCAPIFLDILSDNGPVDDDDDSVNPFAAGSIVFWVAEDLGCGPIEVRVGAGALGDDPIAPTIRTINSFFNQAPECGTDGAATFSWSPINGRWYKAVCGDRVWTGYTNVIPGGCTRIELKDSSAVNTTGDVKFWIAKDLGCGNITVNLTGQGSSVITGFFNSAPDCDNANAGGNFDNLNPGNYSYTASCQGITWSGNITISSNGCLRIQLTN
jgi:hypothetical protein